MVKVLQSRKKSHHNCSHWGPPRHSEGVRDLHAAGFVHLDVKPHAVFVTLTATTIAAKLGDFGTTCLALDAENIVLQGTFIGTKILHCTECSVIITASDVPSDPTRTRLLSTS